MDAAMCGARANELKEMTVAELDADHHQNICSLFSFIDYILLKP
jgi:hypothetical protein